jgi:hypothetical protein
LVFWSGGTSDGAFNHGKEGGGLLQNWRQNDWQLGFGLEGKNRPIHSLMKDFYQNCWLLMCKATVR